MNETDMSNSSETNWAMIEAMTDEMIDRSEYPPLDETFFDHAMWRLPKQSVAVTVHLDPDLLAWFVGQGVEWEQRMVAALRVYADVHRDISRHSIAA